MIIYITFEGLMQPLGRSQVMAYVSRLAEQGHRYAILSFERDEHLAQPARVHAVRRELSKRDVSWFPQRYRADGGRAAMYNLALATRECIKQTRRLKARLIHARSYLAATVALMAKGVTGCPYLFDFRGYWVDEKREDGRWFTHPAAYDLAKRLERQLFQHAAGAVSLTALAADDVRSGAFGPWPPDRPLEIIPTCVDENAFGPPGPKAVPAGAGHLADKLVIGFVGSVNASYEVRAALDLFRRLRSRREDAHLLCVTQQRSEMSAAAQTAAIAPSDMTITSVSHDCMPEWLKAIDWGLLLLKETYAKRASMPTKLGEFLVAGVRPIQHGCNAEVASWTHRAGTGIRLDSLHDDCLQAAADAIATGAISLAPLSRARDSALAHFSLTAGVKRYDRVLTRLLAQADSSQGVSS